VQEGAVYTPAGKIDALEVPETLHALIAARLDGLSADERRLLQNGAVLGKTFTKQALAVLSGVEERDLEQMLAALLRKEVLGVQADPRSPEHGQYGFLQDLLRRVAYETLAKSDRKEKHLAAAAFLEESWGEHEVVEVIASHYLDAYRAAPEAPDALDIRAKAGELLARAGERAASLGATGEGERYFTQAAELADDPLRKAELDEQAGRMAWLGARRERARELLEQAHTVFEDAGATKRAAVVSAVLADIDLREGHPPQALSRLETALDELEGEEPDEELAVVAAQLGRVLVLDGQIDRAIPHLERALELAEALRLPEVLAQALTSKSVVFTQRNRLEEARIVLEGTLERALENDLHAPALRAFNNLAVVYESSDRYADAFEVADRGLELARRVGNRSWEMGFSAGPLSALVLLGRWDEAIERGGGTESTLQDVAATLLFLVPVHCARGDVGEAKKLVDAPALRDTEDPTARLASATFEATVLRAEGNAQRAFERIDAALPTEGGYATTYLNVKFALVEKLEAAHAAREDASVLGVVERIEALRPGERPPLLEAHAHRFRGKLAGDETQLLAAEALFRELALTFWLAVTLLEHGELLVQQARPAEAEPLLAEAGEIFERLRAAPWLERVDRARPEAGVPA